MPDLDIKLLKQFTPQQSWVMEPGDLLYLPPGVAHHGVTLENSLTFSIGFLAPSKSQLIDQYVEERLFHLADEAQRYSDPDLKLQEHAGEISGDSLQKIQAIIRELSENEQHINHWFGRYTSESSDALPLEEITPPLSATAWQQAFQAADNLRRQGRAFFIAEDAAYRLFVEGQMFSLSVQQSEFAKLFTGQRDFHYAELAGYLSDPELLSLLTTLSNQGYCYFFDPLQ